MHLPPPAGSLFQKLQKGMFDAVIIETTGMADPAPVAQTFFVGPATVCTYYVCPIFSRVRSDCDNAPFTAVLLCNYIYPPFIAMISICIDAPCIAV